MASYVPEDASVIEFGPGTPIAFKSKTLPFLKQISSFQSYIPVDLCETYLDESKKIVEEEFSRQVSVETLKTDFIKNVDLVSKFPQPTVLFKGSTIANLSTRGCFEFLDRLSQGLKPEGILLVGTDSNQNESTLKESLQ